MNRKYRKTIIAGNWKMNLTIAQVKPYAEAIRAQLGRDRWCEIAVCLPHTMTAAAAKPFKVARIYVGAQDVSEFSVGAYTGETSAMQLAEAGVKYVIVGHSERRSRFGETDEIVNAKVMQALRVGLTPIICVGESAAQREKGVTKEQLTMQVKLALAGVPMERLRRVVFAYEPLWAIGTGVTATPEQAETACSTIRAVVRGLYGARYSRALSILYGGSLSPANAASLFSQPDVDGGLVGGASLRAEDFCKIVLASDM